jgi:hypothetical protein
MLGGCIIGSGGGIIGSGSDAGGGVEPVSGVLPIVPPISWPPIELELPMLSIPLCPGLSSGNTIRVASSP